MKAQEYRFTLGLLAALGVLLRITDLPFPDFATDEAQAAFAASAAWTPLAMGIVKGATTLFGEEIIVARSVSALFGIACLPLIYLLSMELTKKRDSALLALVVASLFPSHILFSRLAYPSIQECFFWLAALFFYLRATRSKDMRWSIALFFAIVASTMTKTQDILFPAALVLGRIAELRTKVMKDTVTWIIILACIPFVLYVATHPGIAATIFLYGGNMYGVSGPLDRFVTLFETWWRLLALFLIIIAVSLPALKKLPWPFHALLGTAILTAYLLGPGHTYYTTHLVFFSLPIAMTITEWKPNIRNLCLGLLTACTLLLLGPRAVFLNPWTEDHYREPGFWNEHAAEINDVLKGEEAVTVLGDAGHHLRWYLEPKVLVGKNMTPPFATKYVLLLGQEELGKVAGSKVVFAGEIAAIVQIRD
ncbi:MAG TPA: glycosyltransferase family 39 protein [Candidatus Peribacterales bacterium]|nr:glycosyltransferase family 39 protein [Candidatus Peribacterales bacterium]